MSLAPLAWVASQGITLTKYLAIVHVSCQESLPCCTNIASAEDMWPRYQRSKALTALLYSQANRTILLQWAAAPTGVGVIGTVSCVEPEAFFYIFIYRTTSLSTLVESTAL